MTVNTGGSVVGYDDYYPFGKIMPNRSYVSSADYRFRFTSKERDVETGYDYFGARYYDSRIGRWLSADPLADKYPGWSPYNYTLNNPLRFIDPDGMAPGDYYTQDGDYLGNDGIDDKKVYITTTSVANASINNNGTIDAKKIQNVKETKFLGLKSDLVNFGGNNVSSEQLKINLVGFSIYLGNGDDYSQINVTSGDRSLLKNKSVGGVKRSTHLLGLAADISVKGIPNKGLTLKAVQYGQFNGIIFYPDWGDTKSLGKGFKQVLGPHIHVDMRQGSSYLGRYIGNDGKRNRYAPGL